MKLHGTQTRKLGFFFGLEEDKLHGSQTCTITSSASSWVWKGVKLHGSQTIQFHLYVTHSIWRGVKLQGTQTSKNQRAAVL